MEGGTPVVLSVLSLRSYNTLAFTARDQIKSQSHIDRSRSRRQDDTVQNPTEPLLYFHTLPLHQSHLENTTHFTGKRSTNSNNLECIRASTLAHIRISWGAFKISSCLYPILMTEYKPLGMWPVHWYF